MSVTLYVYSLCISSNHVINMWLIEDAVRISARPYAATARLTRSSSVEAAIIYLLTGGPHR